MAIRTEMPPTGDISSPAEFGKKTHAASTNIVTKLQEIPEYKDAINKASADERKSFSFGSIEAELEKGDYHYSIDISYKPIPSPLLIDKFNVRIKMHSISNPKDKVDISLVTVLTGSLSEITYGQSTVIDDRIDKQGVYAGSEALEKTDEILKDLLTPSNP